MHLSKHKTQPNAATIPFRSYFYAAVTVVMWASAFPGIRAALDGYSPYSIALLRYLVASAVMIAYAVVMRIPPPRPHHWPGVALMGFLGFALYNIVLNAGQQGVSAGVASFIVASAPIYMVLIGTLRYRERLRGLGWLGVFVSFSGVALISLTSGDGFQVNGWALLVLVAALAQASYHALQKPLLKHYTPVQFVTYAILSGTVMLLIFTPGLLAEIRTAPAAATWAVVYMGLFPGAIGYVSWSVVMRDLPASVAGSFLYLVPFVAVLIAWLWLGEVPGTWAFVGGAFIIVGVVTVSRWGRA
jgi:drug/metabolite transporter (DMT)-like permease